LTTKNSGTVQSSFVYSCPVEVDAFRKATDLRICHVTHPNNCSESPNFSPNGILSSKKARVQRMGLGQRHMVLYMPPGLCSRVKGSCFFKEIRSGDTNLTRWEYKHKNRSLKTFMEAQVAMHIYSSF